MINLNPKIWGPHAWFLIESIAISLPDTITIETQNELKHFFISLSFLLPCETCRNHFSEYVKATDIMNIDFSTKTKVLTWINNIHNQVRKRNKCKNITIDKTIKYYNEKYNIETKSSYLDIFLIVLFVIGILLVIKYVYFTNSTPLVPGPVIESMPLQVSFGELPRNSVLPANIPNPALTTSFANPVANL